MTPLILYTSEDGGSVVKESLTVQVQADDEATTEEYSAVHIREQDKK